MNNAQTILDLLDTKLDSPVELTLYGRAALSLGYDNPPPEFGQSMDVDAILAVGQAEQLLAATNFWDAIEATNAELSDSDLYVSHLFVEDQVVLRPDWSAARTPIPGEWQHLTLFRLGDGDLLLSKLMRDDPHDRGDALFIARTAGFGRAEIRQLIAAARIPDAFEIVEQFSLASDRLLASLD